MEFFVDYLSTVSEYREGIAPAGKEGEIWLKGNRGMNGYTTVWQSGLTDTVCAWNTERKDMGTWLMSTGTACRMIERCSPTNEIFALGEYGHGANRATRIDITAILPVPPVPFLSRLIDDIAQQSDNIKTRSNTFVHSTGIGGGTTVYLGGRQSERMVRIYENEPRHGGDKNAVRIEVELKGRVAAAAWLDTQGGGSIHRASGWAKEAVERALNWTAYGELKDYIVSKPERRVLPPIERNEQQWRWLCKQVAPGFVKDFQDTGEWTLLNQFIEHVRNRARDTE